MKFAFAGKHTSVLTSFIRTENGQFVWQSYWEVDAAIATHTDAQAIADAACTAIYGLWAPLAAASASFLGLKYQHYTGTSEIDVFSANGSEGSLGDSEGVESMPDAIALEIQRRTANSERNKRGRFYVPGIAEDVNDNGIVAQDMMAPAQALATLHGADQTWNLIVHHARHWDRKTPDATVITYCRAMRQLALRQNRKSRRQNLPVTA